MGNVRVEDHVWEKLMRLKLKYKEKSLNNLIKRMLKMISKLNLYQELENI